MLAYIQPGETTWAPLLVGELRLRVALQPSEVVVCGSERERLPVGAEGHDIVVVVGPRWCGYAIGGVGQALGGEAVFGVEVLVSIVPELAVITLLSSLPPIPGIRVLSRLASWRWTRPTFFLDTAVRRSGGVECWLRRSR
jgi:hypothetical protein